MGLFDKKFCEFCGEKIGMLGNKKLADGNMCKRCAERMSPWLADRKEWTVAEMGEHFAYREANFQRLKNFAVSGVIGRDKYKLYLDPSNRQWFITQYENYMDENPDVFDFSQVTGCDIDIKESRSELYCNIDGRRIPYEPREYDYDYDFYIVVYIRNFIVPDIRFKLNTFRVEDAMSVEYLEYEDVALAMRDVFNQMASGAQVMVPTPRYFDNYERDRINREVRMRKDMQRDRMMAFENWHRGPQGGPPPHMPSHHEPHYDHRAPQGGYHQAPMNHSPHSGYGQAPYGSQGGYGQGAPYGSQGGYDQRAPYGSQGGYDQRAPYGSQGGYGQHDLHYDNRNGFNGPHGGRR